MTQTLLQLQGVSKAFSDKTILQNVQLHITQQDKVGLIGPNGAGKSTLLNIITGAVVADGGIVDWVKQPCSVHYMTQSRVETDLSLNALQAGTAMNGLSAWNESVEMTVAMAKQLRLPKPLLTGDGQTPETASGGERTKQALVSAFSQQADLLILDEPTNHLDSAGIEWLIRQVNRYVGAILVVSHDRYFLDQTVQQIVVLQDGQSRSYQGNYSDYVRQRDIERLAAKHLFETQQKEQARIESEITQLKQWAKQAHGLAGKQGTPAERRQMGLKQYQRAKAKKMDQRVKSQIKRLEKLRTESIDKPKDESGVYFELDDATRHGKWLIEADGLEKRFGDRVLFGQSGFYIGRGERIGLIGPNGCGKTTLLRMILGQETATAGKLWVSPSAKIAYLAQDDTLPEGETILHMTDRMPPDDRTRFRTMLANMEFGETKLRTPTSALSLGERTRVKLAWLILHDHNLLVLDEPTNHLDVVSREELERALTRYDGTLLVVTHDRYFLQRLCDKTLVFANGRIQRVDGPSDVQDVRDSKDALTDSVRKRQRRQRPTPSQHRSKANSAEELMVLEMQIARLFGELANLTPNQPEYQAYDVELKQLMQRRREILITN